MNVNAKMNNGSLTVAALDIGDIADIPKRTIHDINHCDILVCETVSEFKFLASRLNIDISNKQIIEFNNNISKPHLIIENIVNYCKDGKQIVLVAGQGTPLIKDPGQEIVTRFRKDGLPVNCIPGPSAIIAALSISGITVEDFYFAGWIPASYIDRSKFLSHLKNNFKCTTVMFEPIFSNSYQSILDIIDIFGEETSISILIDISKHSEQVFYGSTKDALSWIDKIINSDSLSTTNPDFRYMTYVIDNNFK